MVRFPHLSKLSKRGGSPNRNLNGGSDDTSLDFWGIQFQTSPIWMGQSCPRFKVGSAPFKYLCWPLLFVLYIFQFGGSTISTYFVALNWVRVTLAAWGVQLEIIGASWRVEYLHVSPIWHPTKRITSWRYLQWAIPSLTHLHVAARVLFHDF